MLTSCDIHSEAIDFLDRQIGVKTLQSVHLPEQFATIEKYDVVFVLSFFSHMPRSSFGRWLRALYGSLSHRTLDLHDPRREELRRLRHHARRHSRGRLPLPGGQRAG